MKTEPQSTQIYTDPIAYSSDRIRYNVNAVWPKSIFSDLFKLDYRDATDQIARWNSFL